MLDGDIDRVNACFIQDEITFSGTMAWHRIKKDLNELAQQTTNTQSEQFTCAGCVVESCDDRDNAVECTGKVL
jgi:hypothetical protein